MILYHISVYEYEKNTSVYFHPIASTETTTTRQSHTPTDSTIEIIYTQRIQSMAEEHLFVCSILNASFRAVLLSFRFTITRKFTKFSLRSKIGDDSNLLIIVFVSVFFFCFSLLSFSLCISVCVSVTLFQISLLSFRLLLFISVCVCIYSTHSQARRNGNSLHRFSLIATLFRKCEACLKFVWRKRRNYRETVAGSCCG